MCRPCLPCHKPPASRCWRALPKGQNSRQSPACLGPVGRESLRCTRRHACSSYVQPPDPHKMANISQQHIVDVRHAGLANIHDIITELVAQYPQTSPLFGPFRRPACATLACSHAGKRRRLGRHLRCDRSHDGAPLLPHSEALLPLLRGCQRQAGQRAGRRANHAARQAAELTDGMRHAWLLRCRSRARAVGAARADGERPGRQHVAKAWLAVAITETSERSRMVAGVCVGTVAWVGDTTPRLRSSVRSMKATAHVERRTRGCS
eukprot:364557-Chlamydomonas_euryale.AAC.31